MGNGPRYLRGSVPINEFLYIDLRVELMKDQQGEKWSWGQIERKVDKSMVVEDGEPPPSSTSRALW